MYVAILNLDRQCRRGNDRQCDTYSTISTRKINSMECNKKRMKNAMNATMLLVHVSLLGQFLSTSALSVLRIYKSFPAVLHIFVLDTDGTLPPF